MDLNSSERKLIEDQLNRYIDDMPIHMRGAIERYVLDRIEPGGFLYSVLCNDLKGAVTRADTINKRELPKIVDFCISGLPSCSWGSPEKVNAWLANKERVF